MSEPLPTLGARLRQLREERHETAAVVADAVGISRTHLNNMELNHDKPGRETLLALAAYYGVDLDWLASNEGEPRKGQATAANQDEALLLYAFRQLPPDEAASILKLLVSRVQPRQN